MKAEFRKRLSVLTLPPGNFYPHERIKASHEDTKFTIEERQEAVVSHSARKVGTSIKLNPKPLSQIRKKLPR